MISTLLKSEAGKILIIITKIKKILCESAVLHKGGQTGILWKL